MARSCLKEKNLPSMLWGEAVRHTVYLLNRLPTRALTGVTPYEVWNEKKPHLGHIRIFGCLAQMKIPSQHVRKLDDRSKAVINLGKEPGTKAYRLYDPADNKVWVSRDVTFEEDKSWFWENREDTQLTEPGTFTVGGDSIQETADIRENADNSGTGKRMQTHNLRMLKHRDHSRLLRALIQRIMMIVKNQTRSGVCKMSIMKQRKFTWMRSYFSWGLRNL